LHKRAGIPATLFVLDVLAVEGITDADPAEGSLFCAVSRTIANSAITRPTATDRTRQAQADDPLPTPRPLAATDARDRRPRSPSTACARSNPPSVASL
jgi:hypothetical protein